YHESVEPAGTALLARLRAALASGGGALRPQAPLKLAVLFGSRAGGRRRLHAGSDVDVGIVPADPCLPLRDDLALAAVLSSAVGTEVDLVRLDVEDLILGREVAMNGVCLYESAPGMFAAHRASAMALWVEFEETIAPHRERFLRRLAGARGMTNVALIAVL